MATVRKALAKPTLEKLSMEIIENEASRKSFSSDPEGFIKSKYGAVVSAEEKDYVKNLQAMLADGFCCKGCGCSGGFKETITNPATRR